MINLLYAGIKLFSGICYRSVWFGTLAVYYILLAVMRFALLFHVRKKREDLISELKICRLCGMILMVLDWALTGIIVLVVRKNRREYSCSWNGSYDDSTHNKSNQQMENRGRRKYMKAAIYMGKEKIEIKELPMPECGDNDVLIRNIYSSVCGTDVAVYTHGPGTGHRITVGEEFGHETVSRIVEVGKNVKDFKVGERDRRFCE